jgi:hypothetical protein
VPKLQRPTTDPRIETQFTAHGVCAAWASLRPSARWGLSAIADPAFDDDLTAVAGDMHLI